MCIDIKSHILKLINVICQLYLNKNDSYVLWRFPPVVVQSLSCDQRFATSWTAAHQASLSFTISRSLLKLTSFESVMPSNHLVLCHPLLLPSIFPSIRVFSGELVLCISDWSIGASASSSSFQWIFRTDFLYDWLVGAPCSPRDSQESSPHTLGWGCKLTLSSSSY